jgi:sulfoxide reductase heme-binding subunit YedZ
MMAAAAAKAMARLQRLGLAKPTFWLLLALPALPMVAEFFGGNVHRLYYPSGVMAVRLVVAALLLTPLSLLFPQSTALRWLIRRRRAIGVAGFGYAALHTLAYVVDEGSVAAMVTALPDPAIWSGWLAFVILLVLAATSNDASVRRLGRRWKSLQRLAYGAAGAAVLHWITLQYHFAPALWHVMPLVLLSLWRLGRWQGWWRR